MQVAAPPTGAHSATLQRAINPVQFVILGFGSIVGSGWVVLLGGWLAEAGPGGAMVGIAIGGAGMALVAALYAELGSRLPQTGGEVTYINAVFGKKAAYFAGWLFTLACLSALVFEGVAVAWLMEIIWPPITGPILYVILGEKIGLGGLLLALASGLTIAYLNYRGARAFVRFQNFLTSSFFVIVIIIVGFELMFGSPQNIHPIWKNGAGQNWLVGAAGVFATAPYIFGGFQGPLQAIEERLASTSKETVVRLVVVAMVAAILFYLLVVLGAAKGAPRQALAASDLPAVAALAYLPWSKALTAGLLVALVASVLKTWSAVFMIAVRLLLAQARAGMIPAVLGNINEKTGAPDRAVIFVAVFNIIGIFFGKGAIEPIVNTTSLCTAMCYVLCCSAALVLRRRDPDHVGFRVPGGTPVVVLAILFAAGMVTLALFQPAKSGQAVFKWGLLGSWAMLGLALYALRNWGAAAGAALGAKVGAEP